MTLAIRSEQHRSSIGPSEIRVKGKAKVVPSLEIHGRTVVVTGKWLKTATIRDEELIEGDTILDPEAFIISLKRSGLRADIFTFTQRLPDKTPKHSYHLEWENAAAIPITTFDKWWREDAEYSIRKAVNRAKKMGVTVRVVNFSNELVNNMCPIYNETPVRQGKRFWHYGKQPETIQRELATYLERSTFIGAYWQDEMIGFMKVTSVNNTEVVTQILSAQRHFEKRPNNALIAKAVELCDSRGRSHFIYGSYVYHDPSSSLTEFKRRNGFKLEELPRFYIPLNAIGKAAIRLGFHRGLVNHAPRPLLKALLKLRTFWYTWKLKVDRRTAVT